MSADIVNFPGISYLDLPPDRILEGASGKLDRVVVIGYTADGQEYFASSIADGGEVVWLMERMKLKLLRIGDAP
jgi:hypothetical protein